MSFLSKLFGKSSDAAQSATPMVSPPLGLARDDARAAADKCLAAVSAMAESAEDPRDRAMLLARIAEARLAGDDSVATLRALLLTFNVGMQLGLVSWMVDLCREFAHELPKGPPRDAMRPMIDALARVLEVVEDPRLAQDMRIEIGPLQAMVGDYVGAAATVQGIGDAYFADQTRTRVIEKMCESGELAAAEVLAAEIEDQDARAAATKALVRARAAHKIDADLERLAAGIKVQPYRDEVRLELAVAKAHVGDVEGGLVLARAIGKAETRAAALTQMAEGLAERGELARAEEIVGSIEEPAARSAAWAALVAVDVKRGDVAAAERSLDKITETWSGVEACLRIARAKELVDRTEDVARLLMRALAFLRGVQSPNEAQAARRKTAEILANGGNLVESMRIADVGPRDERADVLGAIGSGLAIGGALAAVDELQGGLKKPEERSAVLIGAATSLLRRAKSS